MSGRPDRIVRAKSTARRIWPLTSSSRSGFSVSGSDPLTELFADLASALGELGVRWYLFGAQAVVLWGRPG